MSHSQLSLDISPDSSSRFDNQMPSLSAIVEQTAIAMEYIEQMPSLNDLPKLEANVDELITGGGGGWGGGKAASLERVHNQNLYARW